MPGHPATLAATRGGGASGKRMSRRKVGKENGYGMAGQGEGDRKGTRRLTGRRGRKGESHRKQEGRDSLGIPSSSGQTTATTFMSIKTKNK